MSLVDALAQVQQADHDLAALSPTPFPLPVRGLEAVVVGALSALGRGDWWVPGLRERVGAVLRDVPLDRLVDGTAGARPYKVAPPTASLAQRALHAVGIALANPDRATLVHLGVGSLADGDSHEAFNLAVLTGAPVIFLVAVHPLGGDAPVGAQLAADPAALLAAHGLPVTSVSGQRAEAVRDAVLAAKAAGGPRAILAAL